MVNKPKHRVHSFRGQLAHGGEDEINLERQNVNLAYRIIKFEIINNAPGAVAAEGVVKIYKESQSSIDGLVNFTDTNLLAVAYWEDNDSVTYNHSVQIIFGNEIFSRNLFITLSDVQGSEPFNYYFELEEVPVTAATLMQLKLGVARKLNLQQD